MDTKTISKRMKPAINTRWQRTYGRGKYKQGRNFLRARDKNGVTRYCCLGVLTDLYIKDNKIRDWNEGERDKRKGRQAFTFEHQEDFPSHAVCKWAGLPNASPDIDLGTEDDWGNKEKSDIASLNDNKKTFSTIAKFIEDQL